MKALIAGVVAALLLGTTAFAADHYVNGYTRSNGTYVAPHYQTNPNSTTSDNYSTRGNVNPYTGQAGTKPDTSPSYGSPYTAPTYSAPSYGSAPAANPYGSMYGSKPQPACNKLYGC